MKLLALITTIITSLLFTNIATAEEEKTRYWFYETAIDEPVDSSFTVRLREDKSQCENSAAVTEAQSDDDKREALFSCIYEKGWQLGHETTMEDGYFVIDLCVFEEGNIIEASYFECRNQSALPFKMAYATDFSPEKALDDAIRRYEILRSGGSLP